MSGVRHSLHTNIKDLITRCGIEIFIQKGLHRIRTRRGFQMYHEIFEFAFIKNVL